MEIPVINTTPATDLSLYTKEYIKEKIKTDIRWTVRSLEIVFANQELDEQVNKESVHRNGKGFSKYHSEILTSLHNHVKEKKFLSPKQLLICRKFLPLYWRQVKDAISLTKTNHDNRGKIAGKKFGF